MERVIFAEENKPQNYVKLVASGDVDETLIKALENHVKRQKKRLKASGQAALISLTERRNVAAD